jgi:hypothetical protein
MSGFRVIEQLKRHFPIDEARCEAAANFNVAPPQKTLSIMTKEGKNVLGTSS